MKTEFRGFERSALVKSYSGETVAEVFTSREAGDQYATARLFAAAPDLLAALEDALERLECIPIDRDGYSVIFHSIIKANAAIARATEGQA
jgi:DNA-binding GntR family transcriptional regulator